MVKEIVSLLNIKGNEKIMDAGCGNGEDIIKLRKEYKHRGELYGLDISEDMISHAKKLDKKAKSGIQFIKKDVTELEFPDESFDIVILKHVLHNIHNYRKAVEECHRVLKTGGKLVVTVNGRKNMLVLRRLRPVIAKLLNKNFFIDSDLHINIENIDKYLKPIFKKVKKVKFKSSICLKNPKPYLDHLDSGKGFWGVNNNEQWQKIMTFTKEHFSEILRKKGAIKDYVVVGLALAQKS